MASLIRGYEYDIFISYRQKDNKYDGWVTEFVDHLKKELEATFKEDVSVYFDINPHNGLLETHDVDDSLKDKLKCLVFIPIISRTYCDPRSFAWEHEFKAFVEQASHDQFGLKVKLPNSNVVSRVLPIRIHDLNTEDFKLCESILGGVLRGVEFVYKSAGVNRPLRSIEDKLYENLNKTIYRDQINKVANAVNDIIYGLQKGYSETVGNSDKVQTGEIGHKIRIKKQVKPLLFGRNPKRRFIVFLLFFVCLLAGYVTYRTVNLHNARKTIAFIPLRTPENDNELKRNGDYLLEALNDRLNIVKNINVIPTISTLQFINTTKSLSLIRRELKANYLIDGNIRRDGNVIKIWIELSAARTKKMLWSKTYTWNKEQISGITWEIVGVIADKLGINLTREEKKYIETEPSKYSGASQDYISANMYMKNAWFYINYGDRLLDSTSFVSAMETYDKAIREDSLFALAYANCAIAMSWGFYVRQVDSSYILKCRKYIDKAISINKDLIETQIALGFYYYYCITDLNKALFYFNKAAEQAPGNYQPLFYMALVYRKLGEWEKSQQLINKVILFNPQEALFLTNIGLSYTYLHKYDSALIYHQKAIDIMPGWSPGYRNKIQTILLNTGNITEARGLLETSIKRTGDISIEDRIMFDIYERNYSEALHKAEQSNPADFVIKADRYIYLAKINCLLNKPENSRVYYDSALILLNRELVKDPRNSLIHSLAGIASAGLGRRANAVAEGEKAIKLAEKDKVDECDMKITYAQILTMVGEYDHALILITYLLNNPSCFSRNLLRLDPVWNPLKELPEYKKILKNIL